MTPPYALLRFTLVSIALALPMSGLKAQQSGATATVQLGAQTRSTVSSSDKIKFAERVSTRSIQLAQSASKMLDTARKDKDVLRADGVNRKLTEINANSRNLEGRVKALQDAIASGDDARANHEYTVLQVIMNKLDQLDQELALVVGEGAYESGGSQVVTTVPENSPDIAPSTAPGAPTPPPNISLSLEDQLKNALAADPDNAAKIVADFVKKNPDQAANIVKWAVTALPNKAVDITKAAVNAAPDKKDAILQAATKAAPDQTKSITDAVNPPSNKTPGDTPTDSVKTSVDSTSTSPSV